MPSAVVPRLTVLGSLFCLAACGAVNVQPTGTANGAASATQPVAAARSITSTAQTRELRGCLHCAP